MSILRVFVKQKYDPKALSALVFSLFIMLGTLSLLALLDVELFEPFVQSPKKSELCITPVLH